VKRAVSMGHALFDHPQSVRDCISIDVALGLVLLFKRVIKMSMVNGQFGF